VSAPSGAPVGFIGLGLMGKPMASNLLRGGVSLLVASRSRPPVDELVAAGATAADSPAEVAEACDVVFTMLPDGPDVRQVLAGPRGLLAALRPGAVVVDASSIAPGVARELAALVAARGGSMLDAPVSGGEIGAKSATLSIMVGGDAAPLERVRPLLELIGAKDRIVHVGESGAGQLCKVCNQMVLGGTLAAVSEALTLAQKAGVDGHKVRQALLGGFAQSRVLEVHGERILGGNFVPGFRSSMYLKDMRIAQETALAHGAPAPVSGLVASLVSALVAQGHGSDDYSALVKVLEGLAGLPPREG
jgi:2-hydroxy-3-oxopropionate reductase